MLSKKNVSLFLIAYFLLRVTSFFFIPGHSFTNSFLSLIILGFTSFLIAKNNSTGWYLILAELFLGGNGNYLSIGPISLRSALLVTSVPLYICTVFKNFNFKALYQNEKKYLALLALIFFAILVAALNGLRLGHSAKLIISEIIPYTYLLYYFPFKKLFASNSFKTTALELLTASVIGSTLFTFATFIFYSSGIGHLQDAYYHWFRDVANGKITDLNLNFYRVVLNEQLLLVPALLFSAYNIVKNNQYKIYWILSALLIFSLSYNLTRIYLVALLFGLLILINKDNYKRALKLFSSFTLIFFLLFISLHLTASRGQSFGLELFGLRLQSIVTPDLDQSSLSRLLLLPKILDKISLHPLLGNGLGTTITVFSPVLNQTITTSQFDWGILQIYTELGLLGLFAWLFALHNLIKKICMTTWQALGFAVLAAIIISTITSPMLFHVLGITLLASLFALTSATATRAS